MKEKNSVKSAIVDYAAITIGAALMSIGIGVFLVEAHVVPGGVTGLAMAIHYLTNNKIPVGLMVMGFQYSFIYMGIHFTWKEIWHKNFCGIYSQLIFYRFLSR